MFTTIDKECQLQLYIRIVMYSFDVLISFLDNIISWGGKILQTNCYSRPSGYATQINK